MAALIYRQQSKTTTQEVLGETGPGDSLVEQDIGHIIPAAAASLDLIILVNLGNILYSLL